MSNPLAALAALQKAEPFITEITTLIAEAQTIDSDGDGVPDIQEFKTLGTKILGDIETLKEDVQKGMELAAKVKAKLQAKS